MSLITETVANISTNKTGPVEGPLRSLYQTTQPGVYHYPFDLGLNSRMHIVKFSIYNIIPRKFASALTNALNGFEGSEIVSASKKLLSNVLEGKGTSGLSFKNVISADNQAKLAGIGKKGIDFGQNLQAYITPEIRKTATEIFLYMPDTLAVNYTSDYEQTSLQELTGGLNRTIGAVSSIAKQVIDGGKSAKNIAINAADNYGAEFIPQALGLGSGIADLALKAQGKAVNPQLQLIYRGVNFRQFSMNFIFTPKSQQESDHVSAIINAFVYASTPTIIPDGGMYFIPPSIFNMQFLMSAQNGGIENDRIFKVGNCVLEDVNVDYAPNGWAAYDGGAPLQTSLTLQFKEIQILDRNRMFNGEVR